MARASGGANNMRPLSWGGGGTNGKDPYPSTSRLFYLLTDCLILSANKLLRFFVFDDSSEFHLINGCLIILITAQPNF